MINFKKWGKAAAVRAVKTFAQTLAGFVVVGLAITEIKWGYALSVSATAFLASILTSVAGLPEVKEMEVDPDDTTD